MDLKTTPLHAVHLAAGGHMVDFASYDMPVRYGTIVAEHDAVRTAAGLFDISHMGRVRFSGPDAAALLDRLLTNRVPTEPGRVKYGLLCREDGGILDDVLTTRLADDWLMVVNASNRPTCLEWFHRQADGVDVAIDDHTADTAMIAVQGPECAEIVSHVVHMPLLETLGYYRASPAVWERPGESPVEITVSRTGYTGEDGFELIVPAESAEEMWRELLEVGSSHGLVPCGLGCRDTLRLEAGMPLYGHELSTETDPLTAGLGFAVALEKGDFLGRDAIRKVKEAGPKQVRVGFEMRGRRVAREGAAVLRGGEAVGVVTSGTHSPTLGKAIGMAYVPPDAAAEGTELEIDVRGRAEPAVVVSLPFYKRQTMKAEHP
ncbi:glycine cleavage system aminomethyltransferase GcvT [Alienimonas californiensis]|uniref:Aminomethyltransferase n=1 Tax=Alienimonas californiensis TaxID=2527989 RepID=A0A517PEM1_9PLAN|nr:glycine cleavage system aminomethyltransferase GcvT [Alienimonas californiensis]QDT17816.1 Glycine cleavage system T protein [Alienimonas californiensis]